MTKSETKHGTSIPFKIFPNAGTLSSGSLWELNQLDSCDNITRATSIITVFITTKYEEKGTCILAGMAKKQLKFGLNISDLHI